jgi:hypothetical protein
MAMILRCLIKNYLRACLRRDWREEATDAFIHNDLHAYGEDA